MCFCLLNKPKLNNTTENAIITHYLTSGTILESLSFDTHM